LACHTETVRQRSRYRLPLARQWRCRPGGRHPIAYLENLLAR
jgi:hypothetical protein